VVVSPGGLHRGLCLGTCLGGGFPPGGPLHAELRAMGITPAPAAERQPPPGFGSPCGSCGTGAGIGGRRDTGDHGRAKLRRFRRFLGQPWTLAASLSPTIAAIASPDDRRSRLQGRRGSGPGARGLPRRFCPAGRQSPTGSARANAVERVAFPAEREHCPAKCAAVRRRQCDKTNKTLSVGPPDRLSRPHCDCCGLGRALRVRGRARG